MPLGGMYKFLRTWKIKVNRKKKDQKYILELGDQIDCFFTAEEIQNFRAEKKVQSSLDTSLYDIKNDILYEDESILVVNKPSKMNVHPWDHKTTEVSLIEYVHDYLWEKYSTLTFKPSLVHRIDRDTTGCILIAKEKRVLEALLDQLQSHKIQKIYHACVRGIPQKKRGTIREKLLRIENAKNESKVRVDPAGQSATTHYQVLQEYGQEYSLLECQIETGRMHQIRVHLSYIGNPIIWDMAYGDRRTNVYFQKTYSIHRQLLHARVLEFIHPETNKLLRIEAPYKEDFKKILG